MNLDSRPEDADILNGKYELPRTLDEEEGDAPARRPGVAATGAGNAGARSRLKQQMAARKDAKGRGRFS